VPLVPADTDCACSVKPFDSGRAGIPPSLACLGWTLQDRMESASRDLADRCVSRWNPGIPLRKRHQSESILVGEFHCTGERRSWFSEIAYHAEIAVQLAGTHLFEVAQQRHLVDGATVFVHAAGEEYRRSSPTPLPQRSTHLFVTGDLGEAVARTTGLRAIPSSPRVALLLQAMLAAEPGIATHEAALAVAGAILGLMVEPSRLPAPPERHSWRRLADEARHEMAGRFSEPLGLEELAASCGVSTFHLCRVFRAVTGETVHRHLTRLRLRAALFEVGHRQDDLAGLALEVGFYSHSHFTHAFRREYGVPPSRIAVSRARRARPSRRPSRSRSPAR
jgi:AraC family transcriptional regulator